MVCCGQTGRLGSLRELTVSVAFRREGRGGDVSTGQGGVLAEPLMLRWHNATAGGSRWLLGLCDSHVRPRLCADFGADGGNRPVVANTTAPVIEDDRWYLAAAAYDGRIWRLYLDGALVGQSSPPPPELGRMALLQEDGGAQAAGWSNTEITDAGSAGLVHGPWGNDATDVFIDVAVPAGYERCEVSWVSWIADSRDHEVDSVLIDGVEVWSMTARCWEDDKGEGWTFAPPDFPNPYNGHSPNQACFAAVTVEAPCSGTMRLNFVSGINQDEADESWAFSNVSVVALPPHAPPPEPEPEPLVGWAPAACPDADFVDIADIALVSGCAHESMLVRLGDCTEAEWQLQIPTPGRLRVHHAPDENGGRDLTAANRCLREKCPVQAAAADAAGLPAGSGKPQGSR